MTDGQDRSINQLRTKKEPVARSTYRQALITGLLKIFPQYTKKEDWELQSPMSALS